MTTEKKSADEKMAQKYADEFESHFAEGDKVALPIAVDSVKLAYMNGIQFEREKSKVTQCPCCGETYSLNVGIDIYEHNRKENKNEK